MRRGEYKDFNEFDPLIEEETKEKQKQWNLFKSEPRKAEVGSTVESPGLDSAIKFLKLVTIAITFAVVLGCAVVSKLTVLLMSAQVKSNVTRPYCNKEIDTRQQFIVTLPEAERATWVWIIMLTYFVPEFATLFRSVRILLFKSWEYPSTMEFSLLFVTESLPAIGSALLVFVVFPELDAIKAAMLTNAVCFIPALITFFSRSSCTGNNLLKMLLDIFAIVAQASAFIIWPLVENRTVLYVIPAAVVLISFGWWENFVTEKSPIKFVSSYAKLKKEFHNRNYFIYSIIAPVKCLLFFVTALVVFYIQEGSVGFLFDHFGSVFSSHTLNITEVEPMITTDSFSVEDAILTGLGTVRSTKYWTPLSLLIIHVFCTYTCYAFGKFACKIMIQTFSFAFAINLTVPVLLTVLIALCGKYNEDPCAYSGFIPSYLFFNVPSLTFLGDFLTQQCSWAWLVWLLSQTWITVHIWNENEEKLARTENLFMRPMYDAFLIDQSLSMNRRRKQPAPKQLRKETEEYEVEDVTDQNKDNITRIYACATMWHETKEEMVSFLKSIFRMDEDQCAHRLVRTQLQYNLPNYYEFETHIHFDDAFYRPASDPYHPDPPLNSYVLDMIDAVNVAGSEVHATNVRVKPPIIYSTPYGGRLEWTLPGKTKMIAHLKDNAKIRNKKRWSQCMYMYYLLGYRIMDNDDLPEDKIKKLSENTYLLALDGDIDFQPQAVHLLVDYMKKNKSLGAACGRIHPVGSGAMAWYQVFEYAVGHWLQKATEHVIGCVLCSPGCFSLFRACALMDDNVMAKYTTMSSEARHYVQYDQGEDRWLCTLLLQRGYRVEYSAASDSYTHCPEGFNEFFNQRRRWMPSTTANILDLLSDYKYIVNINDNISKLYMLYQLILMIGTVIGPGSIFLMLVGAFVAAFKLDQWTSFFWNIIPVLIFIICCATRKSETQLFVAAIISAIYGLVMMAVLIGIFMQIKDDGLLAPSSLFFLIMASQFIITAMLHPQEFYCLKYGVIYYVTVPSMYMLLVIYSVFNMNNVSWGTRVSKDAVEAEKAAQADKPATEEKSKPETGSFFTSQTKDNTGGFEISCASLFKLMCCTYEKGGREDEMLKSIQTSLEEVKRRLNQIEKNQWEPNQAEPRKSRAKTIHIEGSRASRMSLGGGPPLSRKTEPKLFEDADMMVDEEEEDEYNMEDESVDVPENSWFYNGELYKSEVQFLDTKEKKFWEDLIKVYLYPIIEDAKQKAKISLELEDLRDNMVMTFFLINCLYVLVIFLLTLQKETLHLDWPINPTINFTYNTDQNQILIQHTYLELEPIGFVFLISFALLMVIQFTAMMIHRFGTYCQIMANTVVDFGLFESKNVNNLTGEKILRRDPIRVIKKLIKLQGINDDDDEDRDAPVARRNTAHFLALKKKKVSKPIIEELDKAFVARMEKIETGEIRESDLPVPRKTIAALNNRRETIQRRKSQMPNFNNLPRPSVLQPNFNNQKGGEIYFDNTGYEQDEIDA